VGYYGFYFALHCSYHAVTPISKEELVNKLKLTTTWDSQYIDNLLKKLIKKKIIGEDATKKYYLLINENNIKDSGDAFDKIYFKWM
jgi:predicted transcriptional regulator